MIKSKHPLLPCETHTQMLRSIVATVCWVVLRGQRPWIEQGTKLQSVTHRSDTQPRINTQAQPHTASSPRL